MGSTAADLDLVNAARRGDAAAFGVLVERHEGVVFAIALSRLRAREAAEDLVQDVFLRAWLHLEVLRDGARFGAWVARLARNLALDWVRAGQTRSRLLPLGPMDGAAFEIANPAARLPGENMMAAEDTDQLQEALGRLPEEQRELVLLHFMGGLEKKQIAERLGVHPSTVGRQLDAALAKLKGLLVRESVQLLRPSGSLARRTAVVIAAAAALSAEAKAGLAAAAAPAISAKAAGPIPILSICFQSIAAPMAQGVAIVGTGKLIAGAVAGIVLVAGIYVYQNDQNPQPTVRPAVASVGAGAASTTPSARVMNLTLGETTEFILAAGERLELKYPDLPIRIKGLTMWFEPDGSLAGQAKLADGSVHERKLPPSAVAGAAIADDGQDMKSVAYLSLEKLTDGRTKVRYYLNYAPGILPMRELWKKRLAEGRISKKQYIAGVIAEFDRMGLIPKDPALAAKAKTGLAWGLSQD